MTPANPRQRWPRGFEITFDPVQGALAHGDDAVLLAFALRNGNQAALGVEFMDLERDNFAATHARGVERLQHGPVAQTNRGRDVWQRKDKFHLAVGEHVLRQAFFQTRQASASTAQPRAPTAWANATAGTAPTT